MWPAHHPEVRVEYVILPSGVRLRVCEQGDSAAPVALLLHGWGASAYMFRGLMAALADAGFRAVAPDLRGHGLSDKPAARHHAYSVDRLIDDVLGVIRLKCPDRFAIIGHSMGGAIGIRVAGILGERVERLVLIGPAGLTRSALLSSARVFARMIPRRLADRLATRRVTSACVRACYANPARVTPMEVDEYWAPSQFRNYARALRALLLQFDWGPYSTQLLGGVSTPAIVFTGDHDRVMPDSDRGATRLPHGVARRVENAGHLANAERPEIVNTEIVQFLRDAVYQREG